MSAIGARIRPSRSTADCGLHSKNADATLTGSDPRSVLRRVGGLVERVVLFTTVFIDRRSLQHRHRILGGRHGSSLIAP